MIQTDSSYIIDYSCLQDNVSRVLYGPERPQGSPGDRGHHEEDHDGRLQQQGHPGGGTLQRQLQVRFIGWERCGAFPHYRWFVFFRKFHIHAYITCTSCPSKYFISLALYLLTSCVWKLYTLVPKERYSHMVSFLKHVHCLI